MWNKHVIKAIIHSESYIDWTIKLWVYSTSPTSSGLESDFCSKTGGFWNPPPYHQVSPGFFRREKRFDSEGDTVMMKRSVFAPMKSNYTRWSVCSDTFRRSDFDLLSCPVPQTRRCGNLLRWFDFSCSPLFLNPLVLKHAASWLQLLINTLSTSEIKCLVGKNTHRIMGLLVENQRV